MMRAAFVLAVLTVLAASACGGEAPFVAQSGDLGHIHDLALDADGQLLVAAHSGLYRVEGQDRAVLVPGEQHDLMAMAPHGDVLLASGHPNLLDERFRVEGRPPHLGLVRSTDGGRSWEVVGLLGEADFHAFAPSAEGVFAAESGGRVWLLADDGTWTTLGAVEARDLAVDPSDSSRLLASDFDAGVWMSVDGARSWVELEGPPPLVEIEWTSDAGVLGATADGAVWRASAPEGPWAETASVGVPDEVETFYVDADRAWWVALRGGVVVRSDDGGATWEAVYSPPSDG